METVISNILSSLNAMSGWEVIAVILSLAYLLLAMKENILCWYAAFISTLIYTWLFWDVTLFMDASLQVYYMVMAVYGWWQWRQHGPQEDTRPIGQWSMQQHLIVLTIITTASITSGYLLSTYTSASWPYLDSFTTWASVVTTYMVAKKILENWLYWIVIDAFGIVLYIDKALYLTALLFFFYVVISILGFKEWYSHYQRQPDPEPVWN